MSRAKQKWTRLSSVPGDLGGLLDQVGYDPLKIRLSYGTLEISKQDSGYLVQLFGTGGGYCWSRIWAKHELKGWLEQQCDDVEFRRPEGRSR